MNDKSVSLTPHEIKILRKYRNTLTESGYRRTIVLFYDKKGEIIRDKKGEVIEHDINTDYIDNHTANQMFHLWPEPERPDNINELIIKAKEENDLKYFWFFLHFYEPKLTEFARCELSRRGCFNYSPERLMNAKYDLIIYLLKKFLYYKPKSNAAFTTYIYSGLINPIVLGLSGEEAWSYDNMNQYKDIRTSGYILNSDDFENAVKTYMEDHNCSRKTAIKHLASADSHRARSDYFVTVTETDDGGKEQKETTEDVTFDEFWNENNRMEASIPRSVMDAAMETLTEKERYIIRKYNAICVHCNKNKPLKSAYSFSDISERFEGSYKSESAVLKAYNKALEKITVFLAKRQYIYAVRIKRIKSNKVKGSIVYAEYSYQPFDSSDDDNPGAIAYSNINDEEKYSILESADRDDMNTNYFGNLVGEYLLNTPSSEFPNEKLLGFKKPDKIEYGISKKNLLSVYDFLDNGTLLGADIKKISDNGKDTITVSYRPYGSDEDDENGELVLYLDKQNFSIVSLADRDTSTTNIYAVNVAEKLLKYTFEDFPDNTLITFKISNNNPTVNPPQNKEIYA